MKRGEYQRYQKSTKKVPEKYQGGYQKSTKASTKKVPRAGTKSTKQRDFKITDRLLWRIDELENTMLHFSGI
ncbi:hypothetical protein PAPYR_10992 [Paratrimastix pyriformis]|uniref:Uncharacterized protein n=1 Tax=Paratrimastix pyriformis TaxID=342808 RepID=A0ABQ8U4Q4_9EUKA|nr:hypothetical protein PAPYR_10992 [Paratrimastix pyriformis]